MSEERACPELHPADQVMEVVDPSGESMPLLSVAENLTDDVIFINQLTPPLPSLEDHLWINDGESAKTEFVPAEVVKKTKHECSECGKVFRTTNALNKHLLTHQPDRPHLCKQRFNGQDHLTAHMVAYNNWLAQGYKSGYHKVFCDRHSQMCSRANPTEPCTLEHAHPPAATEDPSPSNSYSSNTGFASISGNLGLNCFPEVNRSQSKPVIQESWSLGAVDSNQWPQPESATIDSKAPDYHEAKAVNVHGWEDDLNFPVTNPQSLMRVLTVQPCKEENNIGMECSLRPLAASLKKSQPVSLKKSLQHLQPQNNHQLPFIGGAQACSKSDSEIGSLAPQSHQKTSLVPFPPPAKKCKKIEKPANVLKPPPPPAIRPKMKKTNPVRSSDPHTASLISPSQVAMASFSTQNTHLLTIKGGGGAAAVRQEGKESGTRTLLEYLPDHPVHFWPPLPQTPTIFSAKIDNQQVKNESRAAGQIQDSQGFQMSPLVIPVSVPVLEKEPPFHKQSGRMQTKKQQNIKDLSKKDHHPDLLRSLIIPNVAECGGQGCRAAGGYPSQLRSPTYLVDHLLKPGFPHPPYTPPPMLSPLRPGTGLYFNTLPQCQPCPPQHCSYTAFLDGTDTLPLMSDRTVVSIEPKINVGPSFQAEIPPLRNQRLMLYEEHPAQLLWAPWGDLPTNPKTQQKVTEFLSMCCSSVLPGGGTNTELALYYLHEVQGDVLAALDLLLLRGDYGASFHSLSFYHFTGSDHWSVREIKLFRKALFKHNKDFQLIHNVLQTKSVAQCVEYYYAMKKLKKFKKPKKGVDKEQTAENSAEFHSTMQERCETGFGIRSLNRAMKTNESQYVENRDFTCQECGSCNAHKRSHSQPQQEGPAVDSWQTGDTCQYQEEDRPDVS